MKVRNIKISEIAELMQLEFNGIDCTVNSLGFVNKQSNYNSVISFIGSKKYLIKLTENKNVKAIFINKEIVTDEAFLKIKDNISYFVVENPELSFYTLHDLLIKTDCFYNEFDFKTIIGENSNIAQSAFIEDGVKIGKNVFIDYNVIIKKGSVIGDNVHIGVGTVIGSEGFQLIRINNSGNLIIKHVGGCIIEDNVFIGDNTTICNSLFENTTFIGENTKIDNLVHIAHNCVIGKDCVLTAGVILAGSTTINNNVWLAPNSTVSNRVVLNNNSFIGIGSVVVRNVAEGVKVFGNPAKSI